MEKLSPGRPKLRKATRAARPALRDLLIAEMEAGPRGNGPDDRRWAKAELQQELGASDGTFKDWFRSTDPAPPRRFARKILILFYGAKPEHAERKARMRAAMLAAGIEHDELDKTPQFDLARMRSAEHIEGRPDLTRLVIYQPLRANEGSRLTVPFDLGILRDTSKRAPLKNQKTKASLEIGLTMARFAIESKDWRATWDSIFGPGGAVSPPQGLTVMRGPAHALDIQAREPGSVIQGEPFRDVSMIPLEPTRPDADGGATFVVKAPEDAVSIIVPGASALGQDKKDDLLRILFGKLVPRDASDWFVLEREEVTPNPGRDDPSQ